MASSLFSLRAWHSSRTTSLQVLFVLPLGLEPSTSYFMHFFTQSSSSFRSTCPYEGILYYYCYYECGSMVCSFGVGERGETAWEEITLAVDATQPVHSQARRRRELSAFITARHTGGQQWWPGGVHGWDFVVVNRQHHFADHNVWPTHSRLTALFPGLPGWAGTRKVEPIWILLKQETVSGSGISWVG